MNDATKQLAELVKKQTDLLDQLQKTIASRNPSKEFAAIEGNVGSNFGARTWRKAASQTAKLSSSAIPTFSCGFDVSLIEINFNGTRLGITSAGLTPFMLQVQLAKTPDFPTGQTDTIFLIPNWITVAAQNMNVATGDFSNSILYGWKALIPTKHHYVKMTPVAVERSGPIAASTAFDSGASGNTTYAAVNFFGE